MSFEDDDHLSGTVGKQNAKSDGSNQRRSKGGKGWRKKSHQQDQNQQSIAKNRENVRAHSQESGQESSKEQRDHSRRGSDDLKNRPLAHKRNRYIRGKHKNAEFNQDDKRERKDRNDNLNRDDHDKSREHKQPLQTERNNTGSKVSGRKNVKHNNIKHNNIKHNNITGQNLGEDSPKNTFAHQARGYQQGSQPLIDEQSNRSANRGIYSAIDLGTNNCRLLVARPTLQGFRVVDAFSRIVRLGEGMAHENIITEDAMDRTIDALNVCADKIKRRGVTCMRHVATEACRVAKNSDEFIKRVKSETGLNLEIISAREEAKLAVMGCQSLLAPSNKHALVFDIGGGSTELIWVRILPNKGTEIIGWMSIPWGVVNLTEKFAENSSANPKAAYGAMIAEVDLHLQAFEDEQQLSAQIGKRGVQFLGTSGTVTTLASLHLKLPRYIRERVDGAWMKTEDIKQLSHDVALMTPFERAAQPCIGTQRADLVVAGCAILEAMLGKWNVPSLRVADRGIREGILRGLMEIEEPPRHSRGQFSRARANRKQSQNNKNS